MIYLKKQKFTLSNKYTQFKLNSLKFNMDNKFKFETFLGKIGFNTKNGIYILDDNIYKYVNILLNENSKI